MLLAYSYLVTEYCAQGECYDYIVGHALSRATVHRWFAQLVSAVSLGSSQSSVMSNRLMNPCFSSVNSIRLGSLIGISRSVSEDFKSEVVLTLTRATWS